MFCPSCYLPDAELGYVCNQCSALMCDGCATFALHCRNVVCLNCETHGCGEENCKEKLLVNLSIRDLLKTFCGEDMSATEWERMGQEYSASDIRISEYGATRLPFTNVFSFPQILDARVYRVKDYSKIAKWVWRQIRLANRPAQNFQEYVLRVNQFSSYDFICWYQHRFLSSYSTFEDRIFPKSVKSVRTLRSLYYGPPDELESYIERLKEKLVLKDERFFISEEDKIPK